MTIQQFIKHARRLKDHPMVLKHAIVFYEATEKGFVHRGKTNPAMHELRKLGYFILDKETCRGFGPDYNPTWHITYAGRNAVALHHGASDA